MILDLVGFISTHFQPKPSHGDPFQAKFWPNCQPYILIRTWFWGFLMIWTWFSGFLMILTNPKRCGTSVRSFSTHFRAEISVMCQKTKVSVLWKRQLKPRLFCVKDYFVSRTILCPGLFCVQDYSVSRTILSPGLFCEFATRRRLWKNSIRN